MVKRRVLITGIGAITPAGSGSEGLWRGLLEGSSAVRRITRFDPAPFRSQMGGEVNDFVPDQYIEGHSLRRMDRFAQFGVAAARLALQDANLNIDERRRGRYGVSIGSALGGVAFGEEQHAAYLESGIKAVSPTLAIAVYGGAAGAHVAIELGVRGPNLSNTSSCASGANAIGEALGSIENDHADVMLAGGVEVPLAPLTFGAFSLIKAMSTRNDCPRSACRPFDLHRDGFVMAEGAAILILEEEAHARRRNAKIYARLLGHGQTNDAYHMTAPRPDGIEAARAIRLALCEAGISAMQVGYVNAHATGTQVGDRAEASALRAVFAGNGRDFDVNGPLVSGTKATYGHALGASGAIEAAITAMALQRNFLPGTTNLETVDEVLKLKPLAPGGVAETVEYALSTSFGFGGANAALILGRAS